jgi:hypothetical protein
MAYKADKPVTDDKLLIMLCLGLFLFSFIYGTCFVCTLCDLIVCHIYGGAQAGGVQEWDAAEGVWVSEGGVNRRLEESAR